MPISISKEASFDFSNQPQQRNRNNTITTTTNNNNNNNKSGENEFVSYSLSNVVDKNPWIKRNFSESNNKKCKETSLATHADKDSILSLVESSAGPSSGSDVDGDDFDMNFLNSKFIESLTSNKNISKNISTINANNNSNNDNSHSKVTFDPKLEFI